MAFDNRWVYFCFTYNWKAPALHDPETNALIGSLIVRALAKVKSALSC
jgi:hypothetical protein